MFRFLARSVENKKKLETTFELAHNNTGQSDTEVDIVIPVVICLIPNTGRTPVICFPSSWHHEVIVKFNIRVALEGSITFLRFGLQVAELQKARCISKVGIDDLISILNSAMIVGIAPCSVSVLIASQLRARQASGH